jgi:ADP-heptose:LPS heptosyltransferase
MLSMITKSKNVFFEASRNLRRRNRMVFSADQLNNEEIFKKCLEELPQSVLSSQKREVLVDPLKIIININTSDLLPARRYSIVQFADVIRLLHDSNPKLKIFLTGSKVEHDYNELLVMKLSGIDIQNVAGDWSLEKLSDEIASAAFLLTGDSMPLHMAAFLEAPAVVLWGPTQPTRFGYEKIATVFSATLKLKCSPCFIHPASKPLKHCDGRVDCLTQLKSTDIADICKTQLTQTNRTRLVNFAR